MKKKVSQEQFFNQAFLFILTNGYNGSSVKNLMESMSLSKGSFQNYVDSKNHLLLLLLDIFFDKQYKLQSQSLSKKHLSPIDRISDYFNNLTLFFQTVTEFKGGCFAGNMGSELSDSNELVRVKLDAFFKQLSHRFVPCIREGQEKNQITTRMSAPELADFLIANWEGTLLRMKTSRSQEVLDLFVNGTLNLIKY
jgi:TetR/AcrR family transcriptional repressor of nem operon